MKDTPKLAAWAALAVLLIQGVGAVGIDIHGCIVFSFQRQEKGSGTIAIRQILEQLLGVQVVGSCRAAVFTVSQNGIRQLLPEGIGFVTDGSIKLDGVDMLNAPEEKIRAMRGSVVSMIFHWESGA